jgi:hypothetical protein
MRARVILLLVAIVAAVGVLPGADPAQAAFPAQTWSPGPYLPGPNANPDALLLNDGRALASGEYNSTCSPCHKVSIYDPVTLTWTRIGGAPGQQFSGTTATLLADGRVLITGGGFDSSPSTVFASVSIFDPATNTTTDVAPMGTVRRDHSATRLADGRVLVVGGRSTIGLLGLLATAEIYDPALNTWTAADSLAESRYDHGSVLLLDGDVFAVGGTFPVTVERYDTASDTWAAAASPANPVWGERSLLLNDGRVLATGGGTVMGTYIERYDPVADSWSSGAPSIFPRIFHAATLLGDGRVLASGGNVYGGGNAVRSEIYNPITNTWQMVDSEIFSQLQHDAVRLTDGSVISIGGKQTLGGPAVNATQTYGPDTDSDGYNDVWETLIGENTGVFCQTMRADVNFDNIVNSGDQGRMASQFFFSPVNRRHDQNGDEIMNSGDFGLMASRFNQNVASCP